MICGKPFFLKIWLARGSSTLKFLWYIFFKKIWILIAKKKYLQINLSPAKYCRRLEKLIYNTIFQQVVQAFDISCMWCVSENNSFMVISIVLLVMILAVCNIVFLIYRFVLSLFCNKFCLKQVLYSHTKVNKFTHMFWTMHKNEYKIKVLISVKTKITNCYVITRTDWLFCL